MAEHLASIFGNEKDRVNCPFYFKIRACRHGNRCSCLHTKPSISPTLLFSNMYQRPDSITQGVNPQGQPLDPRKIQDHFEDFYEDLFEELGKYGEIESLNICDNLADHMVGNVYVQFREEEHATSAVQNLTGRFYAVCVTHYIKEIKRATIMYSTELITKIRAEIIISLLRNVHGSRPISVPPNSASIPLCIGVL